MNYKQYSVYQTAYKAAIDLHLLLNGDRHRIPPLDQENIRALSRQILSELAECFNHGINHRLSKIHCSRAVEFVGRILSHLDSLFESGLMEFSEFEHLTEEYEKVRKHLESKPFSGAAKLKHPTIKPKRP